MQLLVAVRIGEMWPPQLARQLATIDQMLGGRLTINIISSDLPGQQLESAPRYRRTLEYMRVLRDLLDGKPVDVRGEFISLTLDPPRLRPARRLPAVLLRRPVGRRPGGRRPGGGRVPDVAGHDAGVEAVIGDMRARAARYGRELRFGYRAHVIVRATEQEARAAARRLVSRLDAETGRRIVAGPWTPHRPGRPAGRAARHGRRRRIRRAWPVDRHRPGPLRRGRGDRRRPDQVLAKLRAYAELGMEAFILSGYPHAAEGDLFARHVLPQLEHGPLLPR